MVVVMKDKVSEQAIEQVIAKLKELGFGIHRSTGVSKTIIGAIGDKTSFDAADIEMMDGVERVMVISEPYKLASRTFRAENTKIKIKKIEIGGEDIVVMAGPCSVENKEQIFKCAEIVKKAGCPILRGGAFKPRTSPYSFQGLGEEGLKMMRDAADREGLLVVTEVMDRSQIAMISKYADILQVGTRNMSNFTFLKDLGQIQKPVILKRGMSATYKEWIMAAEYILAGGNDQVILCERGIRTFEDYTRNTLDIAAIPIIQKLSHLPIITDPSHGTGRRDKVIPMARASVAAGCHGLMVEVHPDPDHALSDGGQTLFPQQLLEMMKQIQGIAQAVGKRIPVYS